MAKRNIFKTRQERKDATKDRLRKRAAQKQGDKKICLTMIVKNEAKNIPRLLDSFKGRDIIDMISIVDTGSTDNTIDVIKRWGRENEIPTTVHSEPFKNFGYNRTHSVDMAKITYPEADYFLLSDADFVWEFDVGGKFDKSLLVDHKYHVQQYNRFITYDNIRLLSSKINFECRGVTHEYWTEKRGQENVRSSRITTIRIDDREDGGCKDDKFIRDENLLRGELEKSEDQVDSDLRTRYKFYLAQTLRDVRRYKESTEFYEKRIADGGWPEEVYQSKYNIGKNYEQRAHIAKEMARLLSIAEPTDQQKETLQKFNPENLSIEDLITSADQYFDQAATYYMDAYNYRKTRAESLYHLVKMYRILGKNEEAINLIPLGKKITYPHGDTLFIEQACYDYLFDYELSIVADHVPGKKELGREAISKLVKRNDLPMDIALNIQSNCKFYL